MNFLSDNAAGVDARVMRALADQSSGAATPYQNDALSSECVKAFCRIFETEVSVFFVATGTAANALALSAIAPSFGAVFCHENAHIHVDEAGAPEFFSGGAKLVPLPGEAGKLTAAGLEKALQSFAGRSVHQVQPSAISLTQPTEWGACYSEDEIRKIAEIARRENLSLHIDGARFANAVANLGRSPASLTWKLGVDIISFGVTKNGALAAEAVVVFNPELAKSIPNRRKQSGQLISKSRYFAAQFLAMFEQDHWLSLARHANSMARLLAQGITAINGLELSLQPQANLVFVRAPSQAFVADLARSDVMFSVWVAGERPILRFVCSFSTTDEEVRTLIDILARLSEKQRGV